MFISSEDGKQKVLCIETTMFPSTHPDRWQSCWPHHICSCTAQCRGCPRWASMHHAAWPDCSTGRAPDSIYNIHRARRRLYSTFHISSWRNSPAVEVVCLTCQAHQQVCQSLPGHSSSHSQHNPALASCQVQCRGSSPWTAIRPGNPVLWDMMETSQAKLVHILKPPWVMS